jgi:hypothetical protein
MENLIPTLRFINGKTYVAPNPKGRIVRRAMELLDKYNDETLTERDVDLLVQYLADVYGNRFDINDAYDGIESNKVINTVFECIQAVVKMLMASAMNRLASGAESSGPSITSLEAINSLYREIIKKGWSLFDLDESDFFALLELLVTPEEKHYMDELF